MRRTARQDLSSLPTLSGFAVVLRAFTFVEMTVTVSIAAILITISAIAVTQLKESSILDDAKNAVLTYAKVARSYAISNQIETMLVVNPYNGRFEIWHLNPPPGGGAWDPLSSGMAPPLTDGYAYAPILDGDAALPRDGDGVPLAVVHPIDYFEIAPGPGGPWRPLDTLSNGPNMDNLTWAAMCFDHAGKQIIRTRRIATRSFFLRDEVTLRGNPNRLKNDSPDLELLNPANPLFGAGLVNGTDTPITSTRGFVISRSDRMETVLGISPTPNDLVNQWLVQTRAGGKYRNFARTVLLDRYGANELAGDAKP